MLRSSLCDHSGAYIIVNGTIAVPIAATQGAAQNDEDKNVFFLEILPHWLTTCAK